MKTVSEKYQTTCKTPLGDLLLGGDGRHLTSLTFLQGRRKRSGAGHASLAPAKKQIAAYFAGRRPRFTLSLKPQGTDFQRRVWQELLKIPCGRTAYYSDIARRAGRPRAVRAAGSAVGSNPLAVVIPCHRVVGKGGRRYQYAFGSRKKRWLLKHEEGFRKG